MLNNAFPSSELCDWCDNKSKKESDDGSFLCNNCWKESVVKCVGCKTTMVFDVTIYKGQDNKVRCQLCDQEYEESERYV